MGKKKEPKSAQEIKIDDLEKAHGKKYVEFSETESKIMRLMAQIAVRRQKELPEAEVRGVVERLLATKDDLNMDMEIIRKELERLRGPDVVREREVYEIQDTFLLE